MSPLRARALSSGVLGIQCLLFLLLLGLIEGQELNKQGELKYRERRAYSYLLSGRMLAWSPSKGKSFGSSAPFLSKALRNPIGSESTVKQRCRRWSWRSGRTCDSVSCSSKFQINLLGESLLSVKPNIFLPEGTFYFLLRKVKKKMFKKLVSVVANASYIVDPNHEKSTAKAPKFYLPLHGSSTWPRDTNLTLAVHFKPPSDEAKQEKVESCSSKFKWLRASQGPAELLFLD